MLKTFLFLMGLWLCSRKHKLHRSETSILDGRVNTPNKCGGLIEDIFLHPEKKRILTNIAIYSSSTNA